MIVIELYICLTSYRWGYQLFWQIFSNSGAVVKTYTGLV